MKKITDQFTYMPDDYEQARSSYRARNNITIKKAAISCGLSI
ncbi:hypothetical protein [Halobacteriovorax sp. HLS]|nr:hypothetical protein [Halobacteriovorax sp. HLS]